VSDGVPFYRHLGDGWRSAGLLNSDDWAFPDRLKHPGLLIPHQSRNPNHYVKTECFFGSHGARRRVLDG